MNTDYILIIITIPIVLLLSIGCYVFALFYFRRQNLENIENESIYLFKVDYKKNQLIFFDKFTFFQNVRIMDLNIFLTTIISKNYLYLRKLLTTCNTDNFYPCSLPIELFIKKRYGTFILKLMEFDKKNNILYCKLTPILDTAWNKKTENFEIAKYYENLSSTDNDYKNYHSYLTKTLNLFENCKKYNYITTFAVSINNFYLIKKTYGNTVIRYLKDILIGQIQEIFKGNFTYLFIQDNVLCVVTNKFSYERQIIKFIEKFIFRLNNTLLNNSNIKFIFNVCIGCAYLKNPNYALLSKLENSATLAQTNAIEKNKLWEIIDVNLQIPKIQYDVGLIDVRNALESERIAKSKVKFGNIIPYHNKNQLPLNLNYVHQTNKSNLLLDYKKNFLFFEKEYYYETIISYLKSILNMCSVFAQKSNKQESFVLNIDYQLFSEIPYLVSNLVEEYCKERKFTIIFALNKYNNYGLSAIKTILSLYKSEYISFAFDNFYFFNNYRQLIAFCKPEFIILGKQLNQRFLLFNKETKIKDYVDELNIVNNLNNLVKYARSNNLQLIAFYDEKNQCSSYITNKVDFYFLKG